MLRVSLPCRSASSFLLFRRQLKSAGKYPHGPDHLKKASKLFRALPAAKREQLHARARQTRNPKLDEYIRFQRVYNHAFAHLPPGPRSAATGRLWREYQLTGRVGAALPKRDMARVKAAGKAAGKKAFKSKKVKKVKQAKAVSKKTKTLKKRPAAAKKTGSKKKATRTTAKKQNKSKKTSKKQNTNKKTPKTISRRASLNEFKARLKALERRKQAKLRAAIKRKLK